MESDRVPQLYQLCISALPSSSPQDTLPIPLARHSHCSCDHLYSYHISIGISISRHYKLNDLSSTQITQTFIPAFRSFSCAKDESKRFSSLCRADQGPIAIQVLKVNSNLVTRLGSLLLDTAMGEMALTGNPWEYQTMLLSVPFMVIMLRSQYLNLCWGYVGKAW